MGIACNIECLWPKLAIANYSFRCQALYPKWATSPPPNFDGTPSQPMFEAGFEKARRSFARRAVLFHQAWNRFDGSLISWPILAVCSGVPVPVPLLDGKGSSRAIA